MNKNILQRSLSSRLSSKGIFSTREWEHDKQSMFVFTYTQEVLTNYLYIECCLFYDHLICVNDTCNFNMYFWHYSMFIVYVYTIIKYFNLFIIKKRDIFSLKPCLTTHSIICTPPELCTLKRRPITHVCAYLFTYI